MYSSLISASTSLSQAVTVAANNTALLVSLHDNLLAEMRGVLEKAQAMEAELAETKDALKKANDELAALKAMPQKVEVAPREEAYLD